jgi:hypothetical protein
VSSTWDRETLINKCLVTLGIKGAAQGAAAEDFETMGEVVDAVHAELQRAGEAPFALTAVPVWAQASLRQYLAARAVPEFAPPERRAKLLLGGMETFHRSYIAALSTNVPNLPTRTYDY